MSSSIYMVMEFLDQNPLTISLIINFHTNILSRHAEILAKTDMFLEPNNVTMEILLMGMDAAPPVCLKD